MFKAELNIQNDPKLNSKNIFLKITKHQYKLTKNTPYGTIYLKRIYTQPFVLRTTNTTHK